MTQTTGNLIDQLSALFDRVTTLEQRVATLIKPPIFGGEGNIFAPSSFWYQPLPASLVLHPNSDSFVSEWQRQLQRGPVGLNTYQYSAPIYIAEADTPTVKVQANTQGGFRRAELQALWMDVPLASWMQASEGYDMEMAIYQPSTDTYWEFWQFQRDADGNPSAVWGGKLTGVFKNNGIWPDKLGTTATSLPFAGGEITPEELSNGEINHVIGVALGDAANWDIWSWPATRSDGWNPDNAPYRIPEGLRFRIDPTVDISLLSLHPVALTIGRALQTYGGVFWDKTGGTPSLRVLNYKTYTQVGLPDPYQKLYAGTPDYAILNNFPWDKMQFLPMDFGKPGT